MFIYLLSKFMGYVYTLWATTLYYSFSFFNNPMRYKRQDKPWAQRINVAAQAREGGSQIKATGTWKPGLLIPQLMLFPLLFRSLFLQVCLAIQKHQYALEACKKMQKLRPHSKPTHSESILARSQLI